MNNKPKSSSALVELYEAMDDERKRSLCDFADFLYARADPINKEIPPPENIPRPEKETVVGAVKRLKTTYHMVGSMSVFSAASALMTDHMIKGRDIVEVIDELEILFEEAYKDLLPDDTNPSDKKLAGND
ncbi:MAG: Crp/Fnr family transcriptional regulator [Gammaproteobacteria bacterium]|nr:Crp/Fnr family transcriptional regulator [Gammaproteobacteria bacterium]